MKRYSGWKWFTIITSYLFYFLINPTPIPTRNLTRDQKVNDKNTGGMSQPK